MTEAELYSLYKGVYVPTHLHPPESLRYCEEFTFRPEDILITTYPKSSECLTWAKEKKNWTVAQWSKVLFSDESKFCISFGNQGPRVWSKGGEAHSPSYLKSSVKFPQSVMIWGAMSSAGVGPLFTFGSWFDHESILYIFYEERIADLKGSVEKIAKFLGKSLSPDVTEKITEHCVFKNMKQNKMSSLSLVPEEYMDQKKSVFLRKGIAGDWKNLFTEKMKDMIFKFMWD
uniref:Sulfotransferase n=1 Tax=Cyprinus carpio TaxID=7962 RepID=A0A8C2G0Z6_CYPCA